MPWDIGRTDTLYCGVEPGRIIQINGCRRAWRCTRSLRYPHRAQCSRRRWFVPHTNPLKTLQTTNACSSPSSTAGVYRTDDGGRTGSLATRGVRARFCGGSAISGWGQCVIRSSVTQKPQRMFCRTTGLYKTRMAEMPGQTSLTVFRPIFGFAMEVDPNNATVFTLSRSSQTSFVARRKGSCDCIVRRMRCVVDAVEMDCRRRMQWRRVTRRPISGPLHPPECTSVRVVENCLASADSGESWNAILESLRP